MDLSDRDGLPLSRALTVSVYSLISSLSILLLTVIMPLVRSMVNAPPTFPFTLKE